MAVSRKKYAHMAMFQDNAEENKYKRMKNIAKKAVSEAMRENAVEVLAELENYPNGMFRPVIGLMTDSKEDEGGLCARGSDEKLFFSKNKGGKVWKDYVEQIMNKENDLDHNVEGDAVEGSVVCASRGGATGMK